MVVPAKAADTVDPISAAQLARRLNGLVEAQVLSLAAQLGIADLLERGPLSVSTLASRTHTVPHRLARVLRALEAIGIVVRADGDGVYALAPLGRPLLTHAPDSLRALAVYSGSPWRVRSWAQLHESVHSEHAAARLALGNGLFEYLAEQPDDAVGFNLAMRDTAKRHAMAVCDAWEFDTPSVVVDVGGGSGGLIAEILGRHPLLKAKLADRETVLPSAHAYLQKLNLESRCEVVACDFTKSVPLGGDVYVLQRILHDWDDDVALQILTNVANAMPPSGQLLIIEVVLPEGRSTLEASYADLEMMVLTDGGRERTAAEFSQLINSAAMEMRQIRSTRSTVSIIECTVRRSQ